METHLTVHDVENRFYDYYSGLGYEVLAEVPAFPSPDGTVLFIGAQISSWKPRVLEETEIVGSITNPQTCIRTQNLNHYSDLEKDMNFCTVFRTHGVLTDRDLQQAVDESYVYLSDVLEISPDRLLIKSSDTQAERFISPSKIEINTHPPGYYQWAYGHPQLGGEGITYAIKRPDESLLDIGNLIEIEKDGEVVAIEWGFGEEILIQSLSRGEHPLLYSRFLPQAVKASIGSPLSVRLIDSALAIVHMADMGIIPGHRHTGDVLTRYINSFGRLATISGLRVAEGLIKDIAFYNSPESPGVDAVISKACRVAGKLIYHTESTK